MIVVSLLLILVAVTLLVLGLAGGSSSLLIGSIVASLLAAVALVVDVRQAAARRRATVGGMPASPDDDPFLADAPGLDEFAGEPPAHRSARRRADEPSPAMAAASAYPGEDRSNAPARGDAPPDFSGSGAIEDDLASRSRRPPAEPAAPERPYDESPPPPPAAAPGVSDLDAVDTRDADYADGPGDRENADGSPFSGIDADVPPRTAGPESYGAAAGLADEFGEPDEDDPADEPLPQAVRPGDAVRVARMDAEVLVVDSRPRYHLADCPHLVGRLTEPLPANEAVELGFSPCGLCRPVDRLVAGTMHR